MRTSVCLTMVSISGPPAHNYVSDLSFFSKYRKLALLVFLCRLKLGIKETTLSVTSFLIQCTLETNPNLFVLEFIWVGNCLQIMYIKNYAEMPIMPISYVSKN